jgi:hypothetical protein
LEDFHSSHPGVAAGGGRLVVLTLEHLEIKRFTTMTTMTASSFSIKDFLKSFMLVELLKGIAAATEAAEALRWGLVAAQARIDVWRSLEASNRTSDRLG